MTERPLILISNDDGFQAKGINSLVDMLSDMADIIVCAPDSARSGFSCAFSATTPLRLTLQEKHEGVEIWSCNGTPTDCVKMALANICQRQPQMVIGGINHGDNASVNAHYSGTMGVTLEGCMKFIPSVAYSLCDNHDDADFEPLRPYVRMFTEKVLNEGLPSRCVAWPWVRGTARPSSAIIRVATTIGGWWGTIATRNQSSRTPTAGPWTMAMWPSPPRKLT